MSNANANTSSGSNGSSSGAGADIDLSQFYQVFFEEATENLDVLEQHLLEIDIDSVDDETLNSVFRCAHSVKGGAATFGFSDVAELTHQMETLLDKLRRHEIAPTAAMVDVLLQAADTLRALLMRHQQGGQGEAVDASALVARIRALATGEGAPVAPVPAKAQPVVVAAAPVAVQTPPAAKGTRTLELVVGPLDDMTQADSLVELFSEVVDLGIITDLPGPAAPKTRRYKLVTQSGDDDLMDLFTFHVSREQVKMTDMADTDPASVAEVAEVAVAAVPVATVAPEPDASFGFFEDAPGAPPANVVATASVAAPATPAVPVVAPGDKPPVRPNAAPLALEAATLRVSVDKVDQLINLVGELVITQAMLAQTSAKADPALFAQIASALADLDRNTRDLQESVMSIRMIPMSIVFNRFPRMLRDLATKLDKKVDFITEGEATELDKGLVEKITDPLTHLVRNSCDHGIESAAERVSKGKRETGRITLAASHQGSSIVIEVRDDGKGLSRSKLMAKARERGIDAPDSMSDSECWDLIFAPGFSTAETVTDISGRGVGMDVVKKNITALGGTVEIESVEGHGMSVKVRLPLTLAIMDGMSIAVCHERYILPLGSVVESFQITDDTIRTVGASGRVVQVRDEYLPVISLEEVFNLRRLAPSETRGVMVLIEAEGRRAALIVDDVLGQQQVVVKNLESNYRRVPDVSGATIMGDGRVALILDVGSLARRARH